MKVVGITGGVGSGKSEVLRILSEKHDCFIIRTDDVARDLCQPGEICYKLIVENFGTDILQENAEIDRPKLGNIVFNDEKLLKKLNGLTHPQVTCWVKNQVDFWKNTNACSMIAVEAALLAELKAMHVCDEYWYVYVKPEIRRERLKASRGYSDLQMDSMFASQLNEKVFIDGCDAVIDNNSDLKNIEIQLDQLC